MDFDDLNVDLHPDLVSMLNSQSSAAKAQQWISKQVFTGLEAMGGQVSSSRLTQLAGAIAQSGAMRKYGIPSDVIEDIARDLYGEYRAAQMENSTRMVEQSSGIMNQDALRQGQVEEVVGEGEGKDSDASYKGDIVDIGRYPMSPNEFTEMLYTRRVPIDFDPTSLNYGKPIRNADGQADILGKNIVTVAKKPNDYVLTGAAWDPYSATYYGPTARAYYQERDAGIRSSAEGTPLPMQAPQAVYAADAGVYEGGAESGASPYVRGLKSGEYLVQARGASGKGNRGSFGFKVGGVSKAVLEELGAMVRAFLVENYKRLEIEHRPTSSYADDQTGALFAAVEASRVTVEKGQVVVTIGNLDQMRPKKDYQRQESPTIKEIANWVFFGRRALVSRMTGNEKGLFVFRGRDGEWLATKTVRASQPLNIFELTPAQKDQLREKLAQSIKRPQSAEGVL